MAATSSLCEIKVTIEIHTASMKSTRGYTIAVALLDELAFWSSETSTEPDFEVREQIAEIEKARIERLLRPAEKGT